jgi:glycosyltransferase involved in cell wall biosynthesis
MLLLSVLIPLYNEEEYIAEVLQRVLAAPLPSGMERELVVVDDGSKDRSADIAEQVAQANPGLIRVFRHERNQGKGAAIRTAIGYAQGDYSIIQDADFEYDPKEYPQLLKPLLDGRADAVYGSRFVVAGERRVLYYWHSLANHMLTTAVNIVADLNLTDMETCYKVFRTSLLKSIPIRSERFGIEPEITIKLAKRRARIYETSISYHGRTYEEGKKIGLKDAFDALYVTLRFAVSSDIYSDPGARILDSFYRVPKFSLWMADVVRPYLGDRVLEIGAGIGNLSRSLMQRRRCYIASDVDSEYLARLRGRFSHNPNVHVRRCDVTQPDDFKDFAGSMDTVVCLNVLEHIEDDMAGLRNIHSALRPGGRAVVLVPHDQRMYGTLDQVLSHYRRYDHAELRDKMQKAGFRVEKVIDFNRISRPAWWLNGRILKRRTLGRWQMAAFNRLVWLWRKIDETLPWPPTSIIIIGEKI